MNWKTEINFVLFWDCFWGNLLSPPVFLSFLQLSGGKLMGYFHSFIHSFKKVFKAKVKIVYSLRIHNSSSSPLVSCWMLINTEEEEYLVPFWKQLSSPGFLECRWSAAPNLNSFQRVPPLSPLASTHFNPSLGLKSAPFGINRAKEEIQPIVMFNWVLSKLLKYRKTVKIPLV